MREPGHRPPHAVGGRGGAKRRRRGGSHPHFRPVYDRKADLTCRNVHLGSTTEAVVVGDGKRRVAQLGGANDEVVGIGSAVEEAVVRMCVEFCVPCHDLTLIEHMFDSHASVDE